jgi:hypothetical protein
MTFGAPRVDAAVAGELLRAVLEARHLGNNVQPDVTVDPDAFANLADNLLAAWNAPGVTMRAAAAIADFDHGHHEIIVDVDDA